MIELLAPAKNLETLKFALLYGADAVYIGGKDYSLRANADNFSIDEIKEAVLYAHNLNKKVYVTVNILFHNKDFLGLEEYVKKLYKFNVDAVIVSDVGAIKIIKDTVPNLEIHLSTQASCMNNVAALFYKELGVKRIVLARECNKNEVENISKICDVECFIHGAMCSSISGQCVLSNYITNRDSNRGGCAQICRWEFDLLDKNNNEVKHDTKFTMCSKDLSMITNIKSMIDNNVASLKIEGRMRSIYYVATILNVYREVIDKYLNKEEVDIKYYEKVLYRCANRDNVSQFYNDENSLKEQYYLGRVEHTNKDFLGLVLDYKNDEIILEQRNYFKEGEIVEIFGPNTKTFELVVEEVMDEDNNNIKIARHPKQIIKIPCKNKVEKNCIIRKKIN